MIVKNPDLYDIVSEIFERRELTPCWYTPNDDNYSDCGNWPMCDGGCPLVRLREMAGIAPQANGNVPPKPPGWGPPDVAGILAAQKPLA